MPEYSFYGGRSGFSFIIVRSFPSVEEMVKNFKKGPNYTEVHFDEHVLINTTNKNDVDNGKIYRRGYDYNNALGGAIYIGNIVGPAGPAPMVELTTIEDVKNKQKLEGIDSQYTEGSYAVPVSLIPGKKGNKYNDVIEWACCCIRDSNGVDATAYIGFTFPYTVIDFTGQSVNPYYNRSNNTSNFVNQNLIHRTDDEMHPFYEKWNINVPKGITGDTFKNFRVVSANTSIKDYTGRDDDVAGVDGNIAEPRKVLVYDYYHYDRLASGEPSTIYLGDYNVIKNISLSEDGTVRIEYTHDNDDVYNKMFRWIKDVSISQDGIFKVTYNHTIDKNGEPTTYETNLRLVKEIYIKNNFNDVDSDYRFHVKYTTGEDIAIGEPINYILETDIDKVDYHLLVYYSDVNYRKSLPANQRRTHKGKEDWFDLGSIKDDSGVLIGFNVPLDVEDKEGFNLTVISDVIAYLNKHYEHGLVDPLYKGKIVTVGDSNTDKKFYAFDYDKNTWYYLGAFDNTEHSDVWTIIGKDGGQDLDDLKNRVSVHGVWFVAEGDDEE